MRIQVQDDRNSAAILENQQSTSDAWTRNRPVFQESANLDLLRSAAVLLVFGVHYYDIRNGGLEKWSLPWHLGQLGVLIFFVHTALVLMWSLERSDQAKHL